MPRQQPPRSVEILTVTEVGITVLKTATVTIHVAAEKVTDTVTRPFV